MRLRSVMKALQGMVSSGMQAGFAVLQACLLAVAATWCPLCLALVTGPGQAADGPEELLRSASDGDAWGGQVMNLSHSGLSGQLPTAWGGQLSLPALRTLDLSGNGLQGARTATAPPSRSLLAMSVCHHVIRVSRALEGVASGSRVRTPSIWNTPRAPLLPYRVSPALTHDQGVKVRVWNGALTGVRPCRHGAGGMGHARLDDAPGGAAPGQQRPDWVAAARVGHPAGGAAAPDRAGPGAQQAQRHAA